MTSGLNKAFSERSADMKKYMVTFRSRYYYFDTGKRKLFAPSKKYIRDNWHSIMQTDEYKIVKIEEVAS